MLLELASLEKKKKKERRRKKMIFSKFVFLASIKLSGNEDVFVLRRVRLSIDIHFVDLELSYDVLSPLPIVLSKHFNHPHPYVEIASVISDYVLQVHSIQWNAGMDTLHPSSCFCSFSISTSKIF